MANKVQFGLSNVYIAVLDTENGTWEKPWAMPGADSINLSSSGNDSDVIWKDNIKYYERSMATGGMEADLTMAKFTDKYREKVLGQTKEEGGGYSQTTEDKAAHFAIMFELSGDAGGRRVVWYDCTSGVPTFSAATNTESLNEDTETASLTINPGKVGDREIVQYSCEKGDENYATFFDAVPLTAVASA